MKQGDQELAQAEHERLPFELVEQIVQLSIEDYLREQDDHEGQQHTRKNNESLAALANLRLASKRFADHEGIKGAVFSTIHFYSIPEHAEEIYNAEFLAISRYVRKVVFWGPLFDWNMTAQKYFKLIQNDPELSNHCVNPENMQSCLERYLQQANAGKISFEEGGLFQKLWELALSSIKEAQDIEICSLCTYSRSTHDWRAQRAVKRLSEYPTTWPRFGDFRYPLDSQYNRAMAEVNGDFIRAVKNALRDVRIAPRTVLIDGEFLVSAMAWSRSIRLDHLTSLKLNLNLFGSLPQSDYESGLAALQRSADELAEGLEILMKGCSETIQKLELQCVRSQISFPWPPTRDYDQAFPSLKSLQLVGIDVEPMAFAEQLQEKVPKLELLHLADVQPVYFDYYGQWHEIFDGLRAVWHRIMVTSAALHRYVVFDVTPDFTLDQDEEAGGLLSYLRGAKDWDDELDMHFPN